MSGAGVDEHRARQQHLPLADVPHLLPILRATARLLALVTCVTAYGAPVPSGCCWGTGVVQCTVAPAAALQHACGWHQAVRLPGSPRAACKQQGLQADPMPGLSWYRVEQLTASTEPKPSQPQ